MLFYILYSLIDIIKTSVDPNSEDSTPSTSQSLHSFDSVATSNVTTRKFCTNKRNKSNVVANYQLTNPKRMYLQVPSNIETTKNADDIVFLWKVNHQASNTINSTNNLSSQNMVSTFPCTSNSLQSFSNSALNDNFTFANNLAVTQLNPTSDHTVTAIESKKGFSLNNNLKRHSTSSYLPSDVSDPKQTRNDESEFKLTNDDLNDELDWLNDFFGEKLNELPEMKNFPKITMPNINLDLDLINNDGVLNNSFKMKKIMAIMRKSLTAIDLYEICLENEIRESLNSEKLSKYFIYNYFYDENLKIRFEYLLLILNIPEINIISLMYESLQNKPTLDIPNDLLNEFVESIKSLIEEYKKAIVLCIDKFKIKINASAVDLMIFFGNILFENIKKFRTINEKVLNELCNLNYEFSKSAYLRTANLNKKQSLLSQTNVTDKPVPIKNNTKKIKPSEESINLNRLLTFYSNINDYNTKNFTFTFYKNKNIFIATIFLNNTWVKCFSNEKTNLQDIKIKNKDDMKQKLNNFNGHNFNQLHNNIYEFFKLFFKKYFNIANEEINIPFECQKNHIFFPNPTRYETTVSQYIDFIFSRYSEILLQYYVEMYSE